MEKVSFTSVEGEECDFYLIMDTVINGVKYVLASEDDPDSDEAECIILKCTGEDGNDDTYETYELVEDEIESRAIFDVFTELLDDDEQDSEDTE